LVRACFVIEGLDLRQADPGRYVLVCLPLKFRVSTVRGPRRAARLRTAS